MRTISSPWRFSNTCFYEFNPSWPSFTVLEIRYRKCAGSLNKISSARPNLGLQRWKKLCAQYLPFLKISVLTTNWVCKNTGRRWMHLVWLRSFELFTGPLNLKHNTKQKILGVTIPLAYALAVVIQSYVKRSLNLRCEGEEAILGSESVISHCHLLLKKILRKPIYNHSQCGWLAYFWRVKKVLIFILQCVVWSFSFFLQTKNINEDINHRSPGLCDKICSQWQYNWLHREHKAISYCPWKRYKLKNAIYLNSNKI